MLFLILSFFLQFQIPGAWALNTPCIAGKYQDEGEQGGCKTCPDGSDTRLDGAFVTSGATHCTACVLGKFQVGNDECAQCPDGSETHAIPGGAYKYVTDPQEHCEYVTTVEECAQAALYLEGSGMITQDFDDTADRSSWGDFPLGCFRMGEHHNPHWDTYLNFYLNWTPLDTTIHADRYCGYISYGPYGRNATCVCREQTSNFVTTAATHCVACPAAKFQTGNDACASCDAGTHGNTETVGSIHCTDCPAGRYAHNARDSAQHCTACASGKTSDQTGQTLETTCVDCLTYQYQDEEGGVACKTCPVSETSETGASNCRPICRCDFGLAATDCTTAAREKCSTCMPGYGLNDNDICAPCEANHQNPSGGPTCTSCPAGQGSERGQPCENCPTGKQSDADGQGCYPLCPVGTFADKTTSDDGIDQHVCTKCALGKYSDTHTSACTDCPLGRAQSTTGAVECQLCPPKTFSNKTGLHACYTCDDGTGLGQTGLTKAADCRDCAANHVYNSGTDTCDPCPSGEQRLDSTLFAACETCPAGQTSEQGQACTPCPSGTYSNDARQCIPCLPGTTSTASSTSADDCIVDTSAQCSYYDDLDCDQLDLEFERDCTQTCGDPAASCSKLRDAFVEKGCGNQRTFPTADCDGIMGGNTTVDACGHCGGDGSSCADQCGVPNGTNDCLDCDGTPWGNMTVDACGHCGGDGPPCS